MNVEIFSTNMANDIITESKLCFRLFMAVPNKYLPILQGTRKEHKEKLALDHLEEKMNETHRIEHSGERDRESDGDNEATDSALITRVYGRTVKFQG